MLAIISAQSNQYQVIDNLYPLSRSQASYSKKWLVAVGTSGESVNKLVKFKE